MIFDSKPKARRHLGPAWLVLPAATALACALYAGCNHGPMASKVDAAPAPVPVATGQPPSPCCTVAPDAGMPLPAPVPVVQGPEVDRLAVGRAALARGDAVAALAAYRKAGAGYDAHLGVGRAAVALGKDDLAFQAFDAASADDPGAAEPLVLEARLCLHRGEIVRGLDAIDRAVNRNPNRADAFNVEGRLEMARRQYDRALIDFHRATVLDPKFVWAFNNAGYVHLLIGQYPQAIEALKTATSLTPVRAYMWNNLGLAYEKSGQPSKARAAFDEALAMRPGYVMAKVNLERVFQDLALAAPPSGPAEASRQTGKEVTPKTAEARPPPPPTPPPPPGAPPPPGPGPINGPAPLDCSGAAGCARFPYDAYPPGSLMSLSRKIARMKEAAERAAATADVAAAAGGAQGVPAEAPIPADPGPPPPVPDPAPDPGPPAPPSPGLGATPGDEGPRRPRRLRRLFNLAFRIAMGGLGLAIVAGALVVWSFSHDLPSFATLKDYHPLQTTRIVSDDGKIVGELFQERRTVVPFSDIPPVMIHAIVAAEDEHFFEHKGLDYGGILRAAIKDLMAMRVKQGASTITQQVVKTFLLTPKRTFRRKIREMILALRLEQHLSKDQILYLYLNQIYLGHGRYGVEAASEFYFGKPVKDVDLSEASILAGLPKAPAWYSPKRYPKHARERQRYVLGRMVVDGYITRAQAKAAEAEPLNLAPTPPRPPGAWYVKEVTRRLEDRFSEAQVLGGGLTVKIAMDSSLQADAERAVKDTLRAVDHRQGYRGPLAHLDRAGRAAVDEAFAERVAVRRKRGLDDDPVVFDLTGLKGWDPIHAPTPPVVLAPPDPGSVVAGLVTSVDPKDGTAEVDLGTARVTLHLADLRWARPFDPARSTRAPQSISDVVGVGDVVDVRLGDAFDTAPLIASEDRVKARPPAPATLPEIPGHLTQIPRVEGALVAIDPADRHVVALVGGYDAERSHFDRATQAKRQPGSSFKPFVYGAALESHQYTVASRVLDAPEVIRDPWSGRVWKPEDAEAGFEGEMSLRRALAESKNVVAVRVLANVGIDKVIDFARRAGITSALPHYLPLALGTGEVTPLEMTNAYATFASGGIRDDPAMILEVDAPDGTVLYRHQGHPEQTISPEIAYLVTNLLTSVLIDGTGRHLQIGRPAAGKTGTANNQRDAWFVGFTPGLVAGAWVGFDTPHTLGPHEYGARAAGPAWQAFMESALADKPIRGFVPPPDIDFVRVDQDTGLLASPGSPGVYQPFLPGTEPTQVAPPHGLSPDAFPFVDQRLSNGSPVP